MKEMVAQKIHGLAGEFLLFLVHSLRHKAGRNQHSFSAQFFLYARAAGHPAVSVAAQFHPGLRGLEISHEEIFAGSDPFSVYFTPFFLATTSKLLCTIGSTFACGAWH